MKYMPETKLGNKVTTENGKSMSFLGILDDYEGSKDILEKSLAKKWLSKALNKNPNNKNSNMKATAYMMDTNIWRVFAGNNAEYAIAGATVELFCASYEDTHLNKYIVYDIIEGENGYRAKWSDTSDDTYGYVGSIPYNDFNKIYFRNANSYWLASPYSNHGGLLMRAAGYASMGALDGYYGTNINGQLKPVVCLKSNIELKKVGEETYKIK